MNTLNQREKALSAWLQGQLEAPFSLKALPQDASFRRYYRILSDTQHRYLAMDAPPELEPILPFIQVQTALQAQGLHPPKIYASDVEQGFLLIEDFGDGLFSRRLNPVTAGALYTIALQDLVKLQAIKQVDGMSLPDFCEDLLLAECVHFSQWFVERYCGYTLGKSDQQLLEALYQQLKVVAQVQPQVFVHRDYHSRNLLLCDDGQLGIIDFQDAVRGPICYDAVSLLRDCYVSWPPADVQAWVKTYFDLLGLKDIPFKTFLRWFDFVGLQRHLKAIFIFARKYLRDHNATYLPDIDRALTYVQAVVQVYPELKTFRRFLDMKLLPRYEKAKAAACAQ